MLDFFAGWVGSIVILRVPASTQPAKFRDYLQMASIQAKIQSRLILSINDHPEMRNAFYLFNIDPVRLKYTVGKELLVTNF